jgi:hypothetical protein
MKQFVNAARDSKAYSLVELIAAISIFSLIAGTIYGVINFGFNAYDRVTVENSLRDEGDVVMSKIMSELYTQSPESVQNYDDHIEDGITMQIKSIVDSVESTFQRRIVIDRSDQHVYIYNKSESSSSGLLELKSNILEGSKIHIDGCTNGCTSGLIHVTLVLSQTSKGHEHQLTLQSQFGF